jgi:hypothetical protein
VSTEPKVQELLSPLTNATDELASRRSPVDRGAIVSRMVEVSRTPKRRFGARARVGAAFALAAGFALATWGGAAWWKRGGTGSGGIEVTALRGNVLAIPGAESRALSVGEPTTLGPEGILETSEGGEARIKAGGGLEIDVLENTKVSLVQLGAGGVSPALRLERGRVRCVIAHQPGRTFTVVTDAARVIDVGTTFSVSVGEGGEDGPRTFVHVEEGEVLVQFAGGERRITATQSWMSSSESSKTAAVANPVSVPAAEPSSIPGRRRDLVKRRPQTLEAETALLRSGLAREQKGDLQGAVTAFETLVARYPESQLASEAKAALSRVKGRLESSK